MTTLLQRERRKSWKNKKSSETRKKNTLQLLISSKEMSLPLLKVKSGCPSAKRLGSALNPSLGAFHELEAWFCWEQCSHILLPTELVCGSGCPCPGERCLGWQRPAVSCPRHGEGLWNCPGAAATPSYATWSAGVFLCLLSSALLRGTACKEEDSFLLIIA